MSMAFTVLPGAGSEVIETAAAVSPRSSTADSTEASSRFCAVLSEHGIKIAPSIYYPGAKSAITLAELAEAYLVQKRWRTAIRPGRRVERLAGPFRGCPRTNPVCCQFAAKNDQVPFVMASKGTLTRTFVVAGTGFEPVTSGL